MDPKTPEELRYLDLKATLQSLTDTIHELEPVVYAGQLAQEEIGRLSNQIHGIEEEIKDLHDVIASQVQFEPEPQLPQQKPKITPKPQDVKEPNPIAKKAPKPKKPTNVKKKKRMKLPLFPLKFPPEV